MSVLWQVFLAFTALYTVKNTLSRASRYELNAGVINSSTRNIYLPFSCFKGKGRTGRGLPTVSYNTISYSNGKQIKPHVEKQVIQRDPVTGIVGLP